MYIAQNYDVPKVDDPSRVYEKLMAFFEEQKKTAEDIKKKVDK